MKPQLRFVRRVAVVVTFAFAVACENVAPESEAPATCAPGTFDCECTAESSCVQGLECSDGSCLLPELCTPTVSCADVVEEEGSLAALADGMGAQSCGSLDDGCGNELGCGSCGTKQVCGDAAGFVRDEDGDIRLSESGLANICTSQCVWDPPDPSCNDRRWFGPNTSVPDLIYCLDSSPPSSDCRAAPMINQPTDRGMIFCCPPSTGRNFPQSGI